MLKHEVPVVYDIIMNMTPKAIFQEPPAILIKLICDNSDDTSFKKAKFLRYLHKYEVEGLYCKRGRKLTPRKKAYYEGIRQKKLDRYIKLNKENLDIMRKQISSK